MPGAEARSARLEFGRVAVLNLLWISRVFVISEDRIFLLDCGDITSSFLSGVTSDARMSWKPAYIVYSVHLP